MVCTPFNVKHGSVLSNNWYREKKTNGVISYWTNKNQQTLFPSQTLHGVRHILKQRNRMIYLSQSRSLFRDWSVENDL